MTVLPERVPKVIFVLLILSFRLHVSQVLITQRRSKIKLLTVWLAQQEASVTTEVLMTTQIILVHPVTIVLIQDKSETLCLALEAHIEMQQTQ